MMPAVINCLRMKPEGPNASSVPDEMTAITTSLDQTIIIVVFFLKLVLILILPFLFIHLDHFL